MPSQVGDLPSATFGNSRGKTTGAWFKPISSVESAFGLNRVLLIRSAIDRVILIADQGRISLQECLLHFPVHVRFNPIRGWRYLLALSVGCTHG